MVGCGLVVAVVLWLWQQFGGCGGDYWVVVVVIFWVVVDFFFFSGCVFSFFKVPLVDVVPVVDVGDGGCWCCCSSVGGVVVTVVVREV